MVLVPFSAGVKAAIFLSYAPPSVQPMIAHLVAKSTTTTDEVYECYIRILKVFKLQAYQCCYPCW